MPPKHRSSTTRLPALLRDELGIAAPAQGSQRGARGGFRGRGGGRGFGSRGSFTGRPEGRNGFLGRKEERKAAREEKKGHRSQQHSQTEERSSTLQSTSRSAISNGKRRQRETLSDSKSSDDVQAIQTGAGNPGSSAKKQRQSSEPSNSHQTRTHVAPDERTPLQRLLEKSEGPSASTKPSSSSSSSEKKSRKRYTDQKEKDEDDEIAWLEAQLGYRGKRSGKRKLDPEADATDGFDGLLTDLDRFYPGMYGDGASDEEDEEEDSDSGEISEMDSEMLSEEATDRESEDGSSVSIQEDAESDEPDDDMPIQSESELEEDESDEDETRSAGGLHAAASSAPQATAPAAVETTPKSAPTRYVPPAARAAAAAAAAAANPAELETAEQQKLRRQLKGLLNRLGESNLDGILTSIEEIYRVQRRAEVSQLLTSIILETLASQSQALLTDTFVVLYASLVAALQKAVGLEFAAGFIQATIDSLLKSYEIAKKHNAEIVDEQQTESAEETKRLANLISLTAHLYNLQVIACPLVYDLVKVFLGQETSGDAEETQPMSEVDVDSLLRIVKTCGHQLRSDDASSLKQIAAIATARHTSSSSSSSSSTSSTASSSRSRFMLETLTDLTKSSASGRQKQLAALQNSPAHQLLQQMRKYLGGMEKKRTVRSREALRVGLKDLAEAKTRGKWWLVGAAWKGQDEDQVERVQGVADANVDATDGQQCPSGMTSKSSMPVSKKVRSDDDVHVSDSHRSQLIALARQHGLSTPTRREIFATLMSSTDYLDAASQLFSLRLTVTQQREVPRVLLHCLAREAEFNPFYALVGMQLSLGRPLNGSGGHAGLMTTSGSSKDQTQTMGMKITFQYLLWDYFRELGEKNVGGKSILATQGFGEEEEDDDDDDDPDAGFGSGDATPEAKKRKMWHLSRAYAWWISRSSLSLSILRTLPLPTLRSSASTRFLRLLLVHLFLSTQSSSPSLVLRKGDADATSLKTVFSPSNFIAGSSGSAVSAADSLRVGLHYFLASDEMADGALRSIVLGEKESSEKKKKDNDKIGREVSEGEKRILKRVIWCRDTVRAYLVEEEAWRRGGAHRDQEARYGKLQW